MSPFRLMIALSLALPFTACAPYFPMLRDAPEQPPTATSEKAPSPVRRTHGETRTAPPRDGDGQQATRSLPGLVGLSEAETAILLGAPREETQAPPGKVWLYRADGCTLRVHLYPDMEKGGFHALDYTADDAPREQCLTKVAAAAGKSGD